MPESDQGEAACVVPRWKKERAVDERRRGSRGVEVKRLSAPLPDLTGDELESIDRRGQFAGGIVIVTCGHDRSSRKPFLERLHVDRDAVSIRDQFDRAIVEE